MEKRDVARLLLPLLATLLLTTHVAAGERMVSLDLRGTPLPAALTRLQDPSGLHLAFSNDLVRDAKPVTLSAKDESVDAVLLRILRPRGLEVIYTGETMAAIVRADSDIGIAKAAGRALRTLARLEKKLEEAVQVGDEVRVPGWTDGDDRALMESIVDISGAASFFSQRRRERGKQPDLLRLLNSFDNDVRVGTCCAAAATWPPESRSPDELAELEAAVLRAIREPDPTIRATGIYVARSLLVIDGDRWLAVARVGLTAGANDPAPEPRFAATFMTDSSRRLDPQETLLALLRRDANPAVRCAARLHWLHQRQSGAWTGAASKDELRTAVVEETHPITNSLVVLLGLSLWERNPDGLAELYSAPEVQGNAWLKLSADVASAIWERYRARGDQKVIIGMIMPLLASGKRSHQLVACFGGLRSMPDLMQPKLDLTKVAALAESPDLLTRIIGIVACGTMGNDAGNARMLTALQSDDGLDRVPGLLGCANSMGIMAAPESASKLKNELFAAMKSPSFPERILAATCLRQYVSLEELTRMLQDEVRRDPGGGHAKLLLRIIHKHPALQPTDESAPPVMALLDAVLESRSEELQMLFAVELSRSRPSNKAALLAFICDCEPGALAGLTTITPPVLREEWAVRALLERLKALSAQDEPAAGLTIAKTVAGLWSMGHSPPIDRSFIPPNDAAKVKEFMTTLLELAGRVLESCVLQDSTPEQFAAGCDLVLAIFGKNMVPMAAPTWMDLPVSVRAAAVRIVGSTDPALGATVAAVLGACYSCGAGADVECAAVLDAALRRIMAANRPSDQAVVLCGMTTARDSKVGDPASAEIRKRLMAGAVPDRIAATRALCNPRQPMPDDFARFALNSLTDQAEDVDFRQAVLEMLMNHTGVWNELTDTLETLSKTDSAEIWAPFLSLLGHKIAWESAHLKYKNQPVPAWAAKAAELGALIMNDSTRPTSEREQGMSLYIQIAGPAAASALGRIALDPKDDPKLRTYAMRSVPYSCPESDIFAKLAEQYAALPKEMRASIWQTISHAPNAPGAEALLIRFLKDREMGEHRTTALASLQFPATPALIAALKELERDPQIAHEAQEAIHRLRPEEKKE
ncbi:MAG TPA: STN domain-containing protein [Planctomycetota bacterium]|nr:STN domain-containing protein [Planctomycetota bacterium]